MRTSRKLAFAAVAVALLGALAVPTVAMASPVSVTTSPTVKPSKALVHEYIGRARGRTNLFNNTARQLNKRLNRLTAIAAYAQSKGADITTVTAEIDAAKLHLANAKSLEATAIVLTKAVPFAPKAERKAAWSAALKAWKVANAELKAAKADKNRAARDLLRLLKSIRLAGKFPAANFK